MRDDSALTVRAETRIDDGALKIVGCFGGCPGLAVLVRGRHRHGVRAGAGIGMARGSAGAGAAVAELPGVSKARGLNSRVHIRRAGREAQRRPNGSRAGSREARLRRRDRGRINEQAAEDGVGPGRVRDRDVHVTADSPVEVDARVERRDRLGIQHRARCGVADLHRFAPGGAVPVEEVQLQVVRLAVGQVHVDSETGGRVPAGGDASGAAGILERPGVGRARGPGATRLSRGRDGGVAGQAGRVADDVVALGAVGSDPVPLRRRVLLDERGRRASR